ncbi:hypothetical protein RHGRI_026362 [Rhododendron griersonianum]|uniref:Uncharacterized protein n=1 Tax=Rhododendron griersonianum TaxID=479676 RepID=A0AAV6IXF6_9ERIC|nr:hypothetical protein RHGRI_026362 [Rhododendron griersonianum]
MYIKGEGSDRLKPVIEKPAGKYLGERSWWWCSVGGGGVVGREKSSDGGRSVVFHGVVLQWWLAGRSVGAPVIVGWPFYTSGATTSVQEALEPSPCSGNDDENGDIDWDNLGFGIKQTDYMYVTKSTSDGVFERGQHSRFGNIGLNPSAGVLNYAQVKSFF